MTVKLVRLLSKIPGLRGWGGRFMERHLEDLQKIDRQIAELQNQNKRSFFGSFALEYIGRFCQSFEIFFMLVLFGIDGGGGVSGYTLTFFHSFLILAFTSLFANILGFLPLQLGGREGALPCLWLKWEWGRHRYVCKYYQSGAGIVLGLCRAVVDEGGYRSVRAGRE